MKAGYGCFTSWFAGMQKALAFLPFKAVTYFPCQSIKSFFTFVILDIKTSSSSAIYITKRLRICEESIWSYTVIYIIVVDIRNSKFCYFYTWFLVLKSFKSMV